MTIKYKDLKKNDQIRSTQLGAPVSGKLLESPTHGKGLKQVRLIWTKGTEVGFFDEHGSVEADDISEVNRDGIWHTVTGHPKDKGWDPDAYLDSIK